MNNFAHRLLWNSKTREAVLWLLTLCPIHKGRVMCVCWGGAQFNCNPKAIALELAKHNEFEVCFAFLHPKQFADVLPQGILAVEIGSLEYFKLLATSQFIITNTRFTGSFFPYKKCGQTYIFTGHGGNGIKKIEFDAASLPQSYLEKAQEDTSRIDLFLSGSALRSQVIRSAYRYQGEILEEGTPRNDAYLRAIKADSQNYGLRRQHYLIYTPTFRNNGRRDVYGFDADKVIAALEQRFGGEWYIRVSSHPNMRSYYHEIYDFSHPRLIDVGNEDLQPLLATSDALITDYSSAEMDFALTGRPVFQLCKDRADYDRGFYIRPEDLPFPYAETDAQLISNIQNFDNDQYQSALARFNSEVIGLNETGHASEAVVEWMIKHL